MNPELVKRLDLFVGNVKGIKKSFPWQEPMAKRLAALVYALDARELDAAALAKCHRMIKEQTGIFSTFRGNLSVYLAAMLALSDDPQERLGDTLSVYHMLKGEKFRTSDYLIAAAYEIASQAKREDFAQVVRRTRAFFEGMRANNRWLVCADDYIYSAMLALSGLDVDEGCEMISKIYAYLKSNFPFTLSRNCQMHLAQIMVLGEKTQQCVDNLIHLNRVLRSHKIRLDRSMVLPSLGILSMLNANPDTLAGDIIAAVDFLRAQKGFGRLSISQAEITMQAVSLISNSELSKTALSTAVTNIIIAQQTAMMVAIITASTAATSAAAV
ncbi:MAG: DUF4003 domain-containing protein [Defluviitaleaceae bacterium]|nr:DUF4003 domain-containing protein [Defluviitaleaceae bacterium]MCL2240492.1 DUF4003 domain-containing protein [Defluviitaleaceae bacterium]